MGPNALLNLLLVATLAQVVPGAPIAVPETNQDLIQTAIRLSHEGFPVADARGPKRVDTESLGVVTDAQSVVIRDVESGVELTSSDADVVRPIASITKLMSAIVLLEEYEWNFTDAATVLNTDVREGGRWRYRFSDELTMDDLFTMMLVASGNNETMAMVREVGASEGAFVAKMNEKASELGMYNSTFAGPIGLKPENVSTARDVQILLDHALSLEAIAARVRLPEVYTVSGKGYEYRVESTNALLTSFMNEEPYRVIGGKTGSLNEAGYCLTSRIERDGHVLDVTVLGASIPDARFEDVQDLVSWSFDVFDWE